MGLVHDPVSLMRLVEVDSVSDLDGSLIRTGLGPQDVMAETKFNGWLAQAAGGRLYSRRGKDLTEKFPHIAKLIAPFKKEHLIGELVYFDENGMMIEPAVTEVAGTKDPKDAVRKLRSMPGTFDYVVFDVLAADGEDISKAPTSARRAILDECFSHAGLTTSNPQPIALLSSVYEQGVAAGGDGVVVKNLNAPYQWRPLGQSEARPSGTWWKLKPSSTDDFVVIGIHYGPKGSLLATLAQYHNGQLTEVSDINNFSAATSQEMIDRITKGPFVIEVEYTSRFPIRPDHFNTQDLSVFVTTGNRRMPSCPRNTPIDKEIPVKGWMLSWKNDDPSRMFSTTYLREETAYKHAVDSIKTWIESDLSFMRGEEDRAEDVETFDRILTLINEGKLKDSYREWRYYADDALPSEDVIVEDTEIVEE